MTPRPDDPRGSSVPEVDVQWADRQRAGGAQLVDVRERNEWDEERIPGSAHIPLGELARRRGELDASRPVVAICHHGVRSRTAVQILQRAGFRNASSMAGGLVAWARAGKPLER